MADPGRLPWVYPYREDPQSTRLGQPVFRPFVQVSLAAAGRSTAVLDGLIDTGADAVLASDLLADQLGLDLEDHDGETTHAVGGRTVIARYKNVELRLHPADPAGSRYQQWRAPVGFIGGRKVLQILRGSSEHEVLDVAGAGGTTAAPVCAMFHDRHGRPVRVG